MIVTMTTDAISQIYCLNYKPFPYDTMLQKCQRLFGAPYYFQVLFPMALMLCINNCKTSTGYIDMQQPGMVYRILG